MIRVTPRSTSTDILLPDATLFRSAIKVLAVGPSRRARADTTDSCSRWASARRSANSLVPIDVLMKKSLRSHKLDANPSTSLEWDMPRTEEHTSDLHSLMSISYDGFCLKKKTTHQYTSHEYIL